MKKQNEAEITGIRLNFGSQYLSHSITIFLRSIESSVLKKTILDTFLISDLAKNCIFKPILAHLIKNDTFKQILLI